MIMLNYFIQKQFIATNNHILITFVSNFTILVLFYYVQICTI
jgi:hypothetical protein